MAGTNQESETIFDEPENPAGETESKETGEEKLEEGKGEGTGEPSEKEEGQGAQEAPDFDGLPFKDIKALTKAYKELQSKSTKRDQEFVQMQQVLKEILPRLSQKQQEQVEEDPEAFVKSFVQNPKAVLSELIKQALATAVEPLQGEVRGLSGNLELQQFLEKHPELEDGDENLLLDAMDRYPELRGRKDRLELWLKLVRDEHPEIKERMKQRKDELEKGASDAKKAASLGGRKSSTPASQGDDFDELVTMWKDRQKFFQR